MNRKLFFIDPVLFKKLNVHLLPLLFMLILGEILHGTSAASVLPDVPYATHNIMKRGSAPCMIFMKH